MTLIHRIWIGSEMPAKYHQYGQMWQLLNPDMELHDWTEEEIFDHEWVNHLVLRDLYNKSRQPGADMLAYYTQVADVVDYEIIHKYGGWYFNTDVMPIKPLSALSINPDIPVLAMEDDIHPVNMAMFSPVGDSFFAKVIETLPNRYFGLPGAFMNATTGVQLLEQVLSNWTGPVGLLPRNVFNPIHWSEFGYGVVPEVEREYPPETVAVHEWLHRTNQRGQRVLE